MMTALLQQLTGTINGICFLNVLLGIVLIGILTTCSRLGYVQATGWIAVFGASIIFGSTGIPFKSPSLGSVQPDPIIFAFFAGFGIFVVSVPLQLFLWWQDSLQFQVWSLVGSLDILITTFLAFQTVQHLGYAKGPAIWASVGMIFSFMIGALAFDEIVTNVASAVIGVTCLIVGVVFVISCQPSKNETAAPTYSTLPVVVEEEETDGIELPKIQDDEEQEGPTTEKPSEHDSTNTINNFVHDTATSAALFVWGISLGVLTGLVDGSLMVPFKLTHSITGLEIDQYLASFGMSSLITTPIIFALYYLHTTVVMKSFTISRDQMKLSMVPGILNGILWGLANFMSVTATYHMSMRIAFPLTQTCVLFATSWGIFYFHEIDQSRENMAKLGVGLGCFMLGTFLLAESSK
ncbi:hypothetical protein ACA910_008040 [Epithemia clementina (nom. ined.)]